MIKSCTNFQPTPSTFFATCMVDISGWVEDLYKHQILSGRSIDLKGCINNFNMKLISLFGLTSNVQIRMFSMGFVEAEGEASVTWFLDEMKRSMKCSPTLICFDEWHMATNQLNNVTAYLKTLGRTK